MEMFNVGGTDLYIHKYLGVPDTGASKDLSQPQYDKLDPTNIQDLLFLENRDRKYDDNIYSLRGHYNVQNLDFDLSQFGLFLNNDIIFVTVHYNRMIELIGRKLMVGDVFELPHLTDYHPLNDTIPVGLRRYYQITDANFASEGFSATWYPHLWRVKCEPLVDSQEFSNILKAPVSQDNYLGDWDKTKEYVPGYTVKYGDKTYMIKPGAPLPVPPGTPCTDTTYWELSTADNLTDILSRYNKNLAINQAMIEEAKRQLPANGYDRTQLYLAPTDGNNKPMPPRNILIRKTTPLPNVATLEQFVDPNNPNGMAMVRISAKALGNLNAMMGNNQLTTFNQVKLQLGQIAPMAEEGGSISLEPQRVLTIVEMGSITTPYGTADNLYHSADQDPTAPGFDPIFYPITEVCDYRADEDPRFSYILQSTPLGYGYTQGYMAGDVPFVPPAGGKLGTAYRPAIGPNGIPVDFGTSFPSSPKNGDYFLRLDYVPQQLFRWSGVLWVKISENVRTGVGFGDGTNQSQLGTFINNSNVTPTLNGVISESQPLSQILNIIAD